jgi:GH24 family phage-related lysozyme (muramidase)
LRHCVLHTAGHFKDMHLFLPTLLLAAATSVPAQVSPALGLLPEQSPALPSASLQADGAQGLLDFRDSDIKFDLRSLMEILRDHRHEGWVLAAYPDPNTHRPLIGAGFSLDVQAIAHPQRDPLNSHPFLEPSSAQLWQAAGLAPEQLQRILDEFDHDSSAWTARQYRRKVIRHTLTPQLTEEEATRLLRISAIQAVYNAKAYCRDFDQLTASQQMALSQLVFQMGTNLEEFVGFLGALNDENGARELPQLDGYMVTGGEHWRTVQSALIDSQWARRYTVRAASVIAMFDPDYDREPVAAEQRVEAVLRPPVELQHIRRPAATLRVASYSRRSGKTHSRKVVHSQVKRKLT